MVIHRIRLKDLRNEEWYQFMTEFATLIDRTTPQALHIAEYYAPFLIQYANAHEVLLMIRKSLATDQMVPANALRSRLYRGLADTVKAACRHYDADKQLAAQRLHIIFTTYGNVAALPYQEETAAITHLIDDIYTSGLKSAGDGSGTSMSDIQVLGLAEWANQLMVANNAFEALVQSRNTELAGRCEIKMLDARKQADVLYRQCITRIEAAINLNGDAAYAGFVHELNAFTDRYNIRHRHTATEESTPGPNNG